MTAITEQTAGTQSTAITEPPAATDVVHWVAICALADLVRERGVAALVHGRQVAVYRLDDDTVWAVGNRDPFSGANVMSRGLVGTRAGIAVLFSPMFKQAFSLPSGSCLDDPTQALPWYPVKVVDGTVLVGMP
ncbi:MAG TPA: nitrite reductase small subunit NirD [Acidothermaceae bacterium]|jgi:nitrite reductase (NADH) small subunit